MVNTAGCCTRDAAYDAMWCASRRSLTGSQNDVRGWTGSMLKKVDVVVEQVVACSAAVAVAS
jgi:hypothetical protein